MKRNGNDRLLYRRKRLHVNWEFIGIILALGLPFLGLLAGSLGEDAYFVGDRIMKLQIFGAVLPATCKWNKTWFVMCLGATLWKLCFTWSPVIHYFLDGTIHPDYVTATITYAILDLAIGAFISYSLGALFRLLARYV